jgi:hypothetical protein
MNGKKLIRRMGVARGRNPLRTIMIPRAIPPSPMTSMAAMPRMNIWSIHGVK